MNIFGAIYGILKNNSAVATIVYDGTIYKIFDLKVSQTSKAPFIAINQVAMTANPTKSGSSTTDEYTMKISMISETQAQAKDLAEKVRAALDYYSGTINGVNIQSAWFDTESPMWDDTSFLIGGENISHDYKFRIVR